MFEKYTHIFNAHETDDVLDEVLSGIRSYRARRFRDPEVIFVSQKHIKPLKDALAPVPINASGPYVASVEGIPVYLSGCDKMHFSGKW